MNIGSTELLLILLLALFLYGKRLPEIARTLGKSYREFKKAIDSVKGDIQKQVTDIARDTDIKEADKIYESTEAKEAPAPPPSKDGNHPAV